MAGRAALMEALRKLRARLAARPDTEHEQAIVRLIVGTVLFFYLLPQAHLLDGGGFDISDIYLGVMATFLACAVFIFIDTVRSSGISPTRRVLAATLDISTTTFFMSLTGSHGVPLLLVYIWVALGQGFRFGTPYLLVSLALSVAGFAIVLATSDFWGQYLGAGIGLMIGMIALVMYARSLVNKLSEALARAEAANQAKRRFISVVSHEMRTPLNAIIGMADLLRDTPLNKEQADMLQTLRSSSRLMLGLIEDVLDFSKIEAGRLVLDHTDFDVHALVNSTCRILGTQATAKGVDFVVSIMPEVPPAVRGDPHYLRQVLINLAGNAVKFTERGSVTVHVSAQSETDSRVRLKFSIRDTGIGIPAEAQARIFESFTQADQSTSRRFGGTGLGTTIAKQLIDLMGGRIGLESAVGLGTTFWFEVELDKQPERAGTGVGELNDARILLAGFPAASREPLEAALASWGAAPVAVASLDEGLRRLVAEISLARPYHSVLLYAADTNSGKDFGEAQRFRRAAPQPAPPVVLAVPRAAGVRRFEALSAGFAAVLELPMEKRQLFNVLHSVAAGEEAREGVVRLEAYARRAAAGRKLHILVADDNPTNREVVARILERGGHQATLVANGEQALDAVERERFDLVLLDRNMPGMSGIEALKAIRVMMRGADRVPVAMLSADVTPEAKREAQDAGVDAFLAKPIEASRLLREVQALVGETPAARVEAHVSKEPAKEAPAPINAETLGHLEDLGSAPGFVEKLIGIYVSDSATLLAKIEQALAGRNYGEFRSHLHALKGSSASMGADRVTRLCSELSSLSDAE
ncbi:MAG TPA: ATP-binding protein, partial [Burkholderiales bacterium]|nr:ATP-binding protein [Burkholderiales bacterium]